MTLKVCEAQIIVIPRIVQFEMKETHSHHNYFENNQNAIHWFHCNNIKNAMKELVGEWYF